MYHRGHQGVYLQSISFLQFLRGVPICQITSGAQLPAPAPGEVKMAGADTPSKVAMDLDGVQCFMCNVYCEVFIMCCVMCDKLRVK